MIKFHFPISYLLLAGIFVFIRYCFGFFHADIELLCGFRYPMPFQSRILIPSIATLVASQSEISCTAFLPVSDFLFFLGTCLSLHRLCRLLGLRESSVAVTLVFGIGVIVLLHIATNHGPIYACWDMPSIFFFTTFVLALYKKDFPAMVLISVLASLNRETAILLPIIACRSLLHARKSKELIALILSVVIPRILIYYVFRTSPGQFGWTTMADPFGRSVPIIINNLDYFFSIKGFITWNVALQFAPIINLLLIIIKGRSGPLFFAAVIAGVLASFFGIAQESRVFAETFALLFLNQIIILTNGSYLPNDSRNGSRD